MSSLTPNYSLIKPGVNDPTDQDLWGGYLNTDMDIIDTTMKTISDAAMLPVGSLYFNAAVATNPATLLGYGTWAAFGQGRVIIGVGTGTDANGEMVTFNNGDTGGEYNHELTEDENGPHTHGAGTLVGNKDIATTATTNAASVTGGVGNFGNTTFTITGNTASSGLGDGHNNIQPYISVYVWKRTA